jgi:predicted transcriptional regulator
MGAQAGLPFQSGSHSSWTGAVAAAPHAASQRAKILSVLGLSLLGLTKPLTQAEVCQITGYPINIVSARVRALVLAGLVRAEGFERGPSGAKRTRWRCTTRVEREDGARTQAKLVL